MLGRVFTGALVSTALFTIRNRSNVVMEVDAREARDTVGGLPVYGGSVRGALGVPGDGEGLFEFPANE